MATTLQGIIRRRMGRMLKYPWFQSLIMLPAGSAWRGSVNEKFNHVQGSALVSEIGRLTIYVSDLARSRSFYMNILGLQHVKTVEDQTHPFHPERTISLCILRGPSVLGDRARGVGQHRAALGGQRHTAA